MTQPGQLYSVHVKTRKSLGGYDTEIIRHLPEANLTDKEELFGFSPEGYAIKKSQAAPLPFILLYRPLFWLVFYT